MSDKWRMRGVSENWRWLDQYASGWQFGEQGIIDELAKRLDVQVAVEIGAGDGKSLPLTIEPIYRRGVQCIGYEADDVSRIGLSRAYPELEVRGRFDVNTIPQGSHEWDLVVVDVDGMDLWLAESVLRGCREPDVLMVEHMDFESKVPRYEVISPCLFGLRLDSGFVLQATQWQIQNAMSWHRYSLVASSRVNSLFLSQPAAEKLCST